MSDLEKYRDLRTAQLLVGWFAAYRQQNKQEYDNFNKVLEERGV